MNFVTWWVEIGEDNMKDDEMNLLLETGKGEAATSAFGTKIDAYPRSCYITSEEGLLTVWCQASRGLYWIWIGVYLSSHIYPFNIQKINSNETVLDFELEEI